MCWGLAAFLGWKENSPFLGMLFVSHGRSSSPARGAQRGQTLRSGALSPCLLTALLKMSLILVLVVPGSLSPVRSHPASLGSELGTKGLARAAGAAVGGELLPLF